MQTRFNTNEQRSPFQRLVAKVLIVSMLVLDIPVPIAMSVAHAADVPASKWVNVVVKNDPVMQNLNIPANAATQGMWSGIYNWPMNGLHSMVLPNGKVLTFGTTADGNAQDGRLYDVWDPSLGFGANSHNSSYQAQQQDSFCATATYLNDGRLMVTGGNSGNGGYGNGSTIFNPVDNSRLVAPSNTALPRWYSTMITLPDSRKLIMGGMRPYAEGMFLNPDQAIANGDPSMTPEIYENGAWRSLFGANNRDAFGPDFLRTSFPHAFVAPNGQVFGISADRMWYLDANANGGNGAITYVAGFKQGYGNMADPVNVGALSVAVMYDIGKVIQVGGNGGFNGDGFPSSNMATMFDINNGAPILTELPRMNFPRRYGNGIVLANGQVVITGGTRFGNEGGGNAVYAAEIWNPNTRNWTIGANANTIRVYHSITSLLPNGTILSTGGGTPGPVLNLNAEVYYPPYLFKQVGGASQLATRPVIKAISGLSYNHNDPIQLDMATADSISSVALIGLSNGTHTFNVGQRRIPLNFTQNSIRLSATIPNANLTPPGYYQVVASDANGVPSYGAIVAIGQNVVAPNVPVTPYSPPDLSGTVSVPVINTGGTANYTTTAINGYTYSWNFGDGAPSTAFSANPAVTKTYTQAGAYVVTLSVKDAQGIVTYKTFMQAVATAKTAQSPRNSSPILVEPNGRVWTVNPDNDSVSVIGTNNVLIREIPVGKSPRTLAYSTDGYVWVTNKQDNTVSIINTSNFAVGTVNLPYASQPHGIVISQDNQFAYIALEATGQIAKLSVSNRTQVGLVNVGSNPRHLAMSADGSKLLVSRFITPPLPGESTANIDTSTAGGEVVVINAANMTINKIITLRHSDKTDTEIQGSGIPNYLAAPAISPDGTAAWVPSKQDNIKRGIARNGQDINFQNTVRAISSNIDMSTLQENYAKRVDHDNSSVGSAAAYHPSGVYLFVALETSRQVAVLDAIRGVELFRIEVGFAPQGLAVSADGNTLYVQEFMDRSVSVVDLSPLTKNGLLKANIAAIIYSINNEKLPANVVLGKQFFYDAKDPRLARDSYMSCASCHNDGGHDGRVWDLTGAGEGLRNTISLKGRGGMGHGFLHWSANFDEVQDFEGQIRKLAGGTGLMSDAQFNAGTRNQSLGDKKAGVSADLDLLAGYVGSLNTFAPSPNRNGDGSLTAAGTAGKAVFAKGCASCHMGNNFTNSQNASTLTNIGTINALSGKRLGATLLGIDVPTLRDVWATAPYLHNGSAPTITAAIQAHNNLVLNATDLANVAAYIQQIDGNNLLLSQGKATTQSSTDYSGVSGRAVDGNTSGVWADNSVTHTNGAGENQPWWQVDLGQSFLISQINLWNRTDCCTDRLQNFYVFSSNNDMTGKTLAQLLVDPTVKSTQVTSLNGATNLNLKMGDNVQGRYVRVQLSGTNILSLAEVQVYGGEAGFTPDVLSQGKAATQSSVDYGGLPARGVDGNTSGAWSDNSTTHTLYENQPWWQVDLGQSSTVSQVNAWNRTDCCSDRLQNFYVLASNNDMTGKTLAQLLADPSVKAVSVASLNGAANSVVQMGGVQARYIRVQLAGIGILSLAEVQVLGGISTTPPVIPPTPPANVVPTVAITEPAAGTAIIQGATVAITAAAADSDGTVARVEFYDGATLLGTDTAAPYAFNWVTSTAATAGTHSLTARAYDNTGAVTTSAAVSVTVNAFAGATDIDGDGIVDALDLYPNDTTRGAGIWREQYNNIGYGVTVADLTAAAKFPNAPDVVAKMTTFTSPNDIGDAYGSRIRGIFTAPETGTYTFWVAGDDEVRLFLSTDSTAANKRQIGFVPGWSFSNEWAKYPEQKSVTINLVAGQSYYLEALHKEGGGGDGVAVAWQTPSNPQLTVMTDQYFQKPSNNSGTGAFPVGVAGAWLFNEGAGVQVADASSNNRPMTLTNATWVAGINGQATQLNGANASGTVGQAVVDTAASFSVSAWVKLDNLNGWQTIVNQDGLNISGFWLQYSQYVNGNKFMLSMHDIDDFASTPYRAVSTTTPVVGQWYHIVGVRDKVAGAIKIYVNGVLEATTPYAGGWASNGTFNVGRGKYGGPNDWVAGAVDGVSAYTRALTDADVAGLYQARGAEATVTPPANIAPTVGIAAPAAGTAITQGATVAITATASDSDGTVARVEFYDGATLLGTDTTAPYAFNWVTSTATTAGTHSLTARAYDNTGAVTTSAAVSLTVNASAGALAPLVGSSTLFGQMGPASFTDTVVAGQDLTGVTVRAGWWLDGIQGLATPANLPYHGGNGGGVYNATWPAGEYLVRIYGKADGQVIGQISFVTNTGRVLGPYGTAQGLGALTNFDYTVPAGSKVLGFTGRDNGALNSIGVIYGSVGAVTIPTTPIAITVPNYNFEAQVLADGALGAIDGWTGGSGSFNPSATWYTTLAGNAVVGTMAGPNAAFFYGAGATPLQTNTNRTIATGDNYTLTVAIGNRTSAEVYGGAIIQLLANGNVVATSNVATPPTGQGNFGDVPLNWTAPASANGAVLGIRISIAGGTYLDIDNVRVTATAAGSTPPPTNAGVTASLDCASKRNVAGSDVILLMG